MVARGVGSSLDVGEMNGNHAPPTGDHEGPHNPTQPRSPLRIIRSPAYLPISHIEVLNSFRKMEGIQCVVT